MRPATKGFLKMTAVYVVGIAAVFLAFVIMGVCMGDIRL